MVETTIQLKPQDQWRPGMTMDKIIAELDKTVRLPGWRICGFRRFVTVSTCSYDQKPIGIKVSGNVLADIDATADKLKRCQNRAGRLFGAG
jgi:Cu(I)/Ag(I) efflux system membrane protein CusA/SilA